MSKRYISHAKRLAEFGGRKIIANSIRPQSGEKSLLLGRKKKVFEMKLVSN